LYFLPSIQFSTHENNQPPIGGRMDCRRNYVPIYLLITKLLTMENFQTQQIINALSIVVLCVVFAAVLYGVYRREQNRESKKQTTRNWRNLNNN